MSHTKTGSSGSTHRCKQIRAGGLDTLQRGNIRPSSIEARNRVGLGSITNSTHPGASVFVQRLCASRANCVGWGIQVGTHFEVASQRSSSPSLVGAGACGLARKLHIAIVTEESASVSLNFAGAVAGYSPWGIAESWARQRSASQWIATPSE